MKITIGTKNQVFKTIGYSEDFKPVLLFKIGQRKQAIEDLTCYLSDEIRCYLNLNLGLPQKEEDRIILMLRDRAQVRAMEIIDSATGKGSDYDPCIFENRFFSFLPACNKA